MRFLNASFSCDTVVATGAATKDGVALFGKNSDREPNEAQAVLSIPAAVHPAGATVKLTFIEIPQVEHTRGVLLSKPFWMWGAEMGVNDKGVAIGNEAVFTKEPYGKTPGLIGMDMLRLALERSESAETAVSVITALLEKFGQSGNCGYQHKLYYHNSFIIADPQRAFVLETSGKHWAMKEINGVYAISNGLTIEDDWDAASDDLVEFALDKGWCKRRSNFGFNLCYSDFLYTHFSDCRKRRQANMQALADSAGNITVETFMRLLRNHNNGAENAFRPDKGFTGSSVCMHAGPGPIRGSQTVGSMVSHLDGEVPIHFVTGTAAPCTSIFKPVWIDAPADMGPPPGAIYNEETLYWRHELLHRTMLQDMSLLEKFQSERNALEDKFISRALLISKKDGNSRRDFSNQAFADADKLEKAWLSRLSETPNKNQSLWHKSAWKKWNRLAGIPLLGENNER